MSVWRTVALGDIFEIARGGSPRPIDDYVTDDPNGINWVMIGDASEGSKYITKTKKRIREEGVKRSRMVQPGDFLLTNSMSFGRPYIMRTSGCIHDGWLVLSKRSEVVDHDYFYHLLGSNAVYTEFTRLAAGATVKNLNIELVRGLRVPLPPLSEQQRIAEVLDRADALRAKRRAALAQLDILTEAIFLSLFGDPAANPKGWKVTTLDSQIESVRYGTGSPPQYVEEGIPFIRATNVKGGTINSRELKRISPRDAERIAKCRVGFGNLIVVRSGVNTGDCAIVPLRYDGAYAAYDLIVELSFANAIFYNFLINSSYGKRHLAPLTRRAAQPHLNADQLRALEFIAPPSQRKEEFAHLLAAVDKLKAVHRVSLTEMDTLFASLQHRAFRGEL